jgi:23S rRNA (guanosine2251-2'-O)-methyltransferase
MRKLSMAELNRLDVGDFKKSTKLPVILVLDNIRSLSNIGSIFRTADAFKLEGIYLCGISGRPPHREIHKTALGATETVDWKYFEKSLDAISELKSLGYSIVAVEQTDKSQMLHTFIWPNKTALVLGNEVDGVSDSVIDLIDAAVEVPQSGTKHSLNVSVCAGIVCWQYYQLKLI